MNRIPHILQTLTLAALALLTPALSTTQAHAAEARTTAAYGSDRRIESLARQLEANGDNLYSYIQKMIPKPTGLVRDIVRDIRAFENSADHFRNEVVDRGAYSREARDNYATMRRAWSKAQSNYRHLPNDRQLQNYRSQINTTISNLERIYDRNDGNDGVQPPLAELASLSANVTSRAEQLLSVVRGEDERGGVKGKGRGQNSGVGRFAELRSRAAALERTVRNRPYDGENARRDLSRLQSAYNDTNRLAIDYGNRARDLHRQLGSQIQRLTRLIQTGSSGGGHSPWSSISN